MRSGIEVAVGCTDELEHKVLPRIAASEGDIAARFETAAETLQSIEAECLVALRAAGESAEGLAKRVSTVQSLMTPHVEGCALMRQSVALLRDLLSGLPNDAVTAEEARHLHGLLAAQYTMAEERAVFEASFGNALPSAPAPTAPAAAAPRRWSPPPATRRPPRTTPRLQYAIMRSGRVGSCCARVRPADSGRLDYILFCLIASFFIHLCAS